MIKVSLLFASIVILFSCSVEQDSIQDSKMTVQHKNIIVGEYILSLDNSISIDSIMKKLSDYGPKMLDDLKRGRYLLRFAQDPGLDTLKDLNCFTEKKCTVQYNYRYKATNNNSQETLKIKH